MWQELVQDEVWYTEDFIKENTVDKILDKIKQADTKVLDGNEQPHIISKSYYNYNHVKYNIREDSGVVAQIVIKSTKDLNLPFFSLSFTMFEIASYPTFFNAPKA